MIKSGIFGLLFFGFVVGAKWLANTRHFIDFFGCQVGICERTVG